MKKYLIIVILALLGVIQSLAQENGYVPFVREGVQWICFYENRGTYYPQWRDQFFQPGKNYFTLEIKGDSVINGLLYKAMHKYCGDSINSVNDTVLVYLREENKIVYGIVPGGQEKTFPDFWISYGPLHSSNVEELLKAGEEFILLNFNDPETFYRNICNHFNDYGFESLGIDELGLGEQKAKRHKFRIRDTFDYYVIEGIGVDGYRAGYPLSYLHTDVNPILEPAYYLSHVVENGEIVYKSVNYGEVAPTDGRMPIVRDGVQWVNEKVIINNGDTTRYYYTDEIRGVIPTDGFNAKKCHYYTGEKINHDNDSIISFLMEAPFDVSVFCGSNLALQKVVSEGRNMLQFDSHEGDLNTQLYMIGRNLVPGFVAGVIIRQNMCQEKPSTLNRENFKQVDPILVEGHECQRWAYVDAQGEPICYLVEGIGFDSRNMGDLLTPFTRQPGADADYQEYCGLSHVIKDGEIIYKGMRFNPDKVYGLKGDINGDGKVTIGDVTALINLLLKGGEKGSLYRLDMNANGKLDIGDVTQLIDYLLSH